MSSSALLRKAGVLSVPETLRLNWLEAWSVVFFNCLSPLSELYFFFVSYPKPWIYLFIEVNSLSIFSPTYVCSISVCFKVYDIPVHSSLRDLATWLRSLKDWDTRLINAAFCSLVFFMLAFWSWNKIDCLHQLVVERHLTKTSSKGLALVLIKVLLKFLLVGGNFSVC